MTREISERIKALEYNEEMSTDVNEINIISRSLAYTSHQWTERNIDG